MRRVLLRDVARHGPLDRRPMRWFCEGRCRVAGGSPVPGRAIDARALVARPSGRSENVSPA
jgi:hypothetical protein